MVNKKGFTLIEVLIVVVIIAVLAALILPRFMNQMERAVIAEAQQQLGAMRRAQIAYLDERDQLDVQAISACPHAGGCNIAEWERIRMKPPTSVSKYDLSCAGVGNSGSCVATRVNSANGTYDGSTVTLVVNSGVFSCGGEYILINAADASKGCITK